MTSPATDEPGEEERPPAPNGPPPPNNGGVRLRRVLWLLGLLAAMPVILTLIGAATSPPHARGVPVGHLIYLDADQPSEKTTILRGLYITQPGGPPRLLVHEEEPQDTDAGIRQWITEPAASPDGAQVAYIQQNITLLEETHTQVTQLWVMPLNAPSAKPHLLLDLTKLHLKQIVGLTWTPDSRTIVFLQDAVRYDVSAATGQTMTRPLVNCPSLKVSPGVSATRSPAFAPNGSETFVAVNEDGESFVSSRGGAPSGDAYASSPDGSRTAIAFNDGYDDEVSTQPDASPAILVFPLEGSEARERVFHPHWGWSVFGGRHITSLRWSPDGKYIGFTVSKPPVPEDELFYLDLASGKTFQLPVRTGRAAWDWTR